MVKGPDEYTVKFRLLEETHYDVWKGTSVEDVTKQFWDWVKSTPILTFRLRGGGMTTVPNTAVNGVEVFK